MRLLTDASVLWLAIQLCRDDHRATLLIAGVVAIVAVYSIYGLLLSAFHGGAIPFFDVPDRRAVRPLDLRQSQQFRDLRRPRLRRRRRFDLAALSSRSPRSGRASLLPALETDRSDRSARLLLIGAGFVILVALLGTVSRGGILATALGACSRFSSCPSRVKRAAAGSRSKRSSSS